jgi:Ni/Co efflux regulator RcnB
MQTIHLIKGHTLALLIAGIFMAAPVLADKPSHEGGKGNGKGASHEQRERHDAAKQSEHERDEHKGVVFFDERRRSVAHNYYQEQFTKGRCPPGLAKKHNGCMPPGQAKNWSMGQPLAANVVRYDLPPALVTQLGQPPNGQRYVRVGNDILLVSPVTGLVLDVLRNLGQI